jgi:hypothetical protein
MNFWHWIARELPKGFRRSQEVRVDLAASYRRVFVDGGADKKDAQIVLTDIANFSGFYRVNGMGFDPHDRAFSDGMRAVYGRIQNFIRTTPEEARMLEEAARAQAIADAEEGPLF